MVAHALTPDIVEISVAQQANVQTVPLRVTSMTLMARTAPGEEGVPAQVAHVNAPYDLALAQADSQRSLEPLPYAGVCPTERDTSRSPREVYRLEIGVVTLVTARNEKAYDTGQDHLIIGKVLAKVPVATNYLTQTKLNVNMFTADLAVQPGDIALPCWPGRQASRSWSGWSCPPCTPPRCLPTWRVLILCWHWQRHCVLATSGQSKSLLVRSPATTSLEQR